jgi:hypothetical protein
VSEAHQAFVSYSHDSQLHQQAVLGLTDRLRNHGVDAWLDQYEIAPPEGWPRWMIQQIEQARFVLLVCTENYYKRVSGTDSAPEQRPGRRACAQPQADQTADVRACQLRSVTPPCSPSGLISRYSERERKGCPPLHQMCARAQIILKVTP